ncbi:nuclease-related domain-containing protein [Aquisalimonas sp.]|uniref:nuclease-related domain-containing protein n=1 Tax=unclassified Aquisalimonas TaxID=2644645 RepID=UPI0025C14848|nr:nuclease-related domain-containing protein [Aquisalimonas sp.]
MIESSQLLEIFWHHGGWVLSAVFILSGLKLVAVPKLKGAIGEVAVRSRLKGLASEELHDCILPDGRGGLTQIDHLYLTGKGIRVVETKNFGGWIFGSAKQKTWTQRLGRRSIRIQNPLRQNWGHIQAVKAIVGDRVPVHGHVVVGGRAEFPKGMPEGVQRPRALASEFRAEGLPLPEWTKPWQELRAATRGDASARKAHRAGLARKHGVDSAASVGMVMIGAGAALGAFYLFSVQVG